MEISVNKIAEWMFNEVKSAGILYQTDAVNYIINNFGETFIYVNENGNQAISKDVKKEFKKLHAGRAVWERDVQPTFLPSEFPVRYVLFLQV